MGNVCSQGRKRNFAEDCVHVDREKKRQRNSPIRLNIGGVKYVVSCESLVKCDYFRVLLEGSFADSLEDEMFVDRDGQIFQHLLNFMRSNRRPDESILKNHRRQLMAEAEFFGFDAFLRVLRGSTDPFQLLPDDREMHFAEAECAEFFQAEHLLEEHIKAWESSLLVDVFLHQVSFRARAAMELQLPLLKPHFGPEPELICTDIDDFRRRLSRQLEPVETSSDTDTSDDGITIRRRDGELLNDLEKIDGVVIAGGSVLAALTDGSASDIDIFLIAADDAIAQQRLHEILLAIKRNDRLRHPEWRYMKLARTQHTVTVQREEGAPIQIILALYRSRLEVILHFDIDVCCFLYDLKRRLVLCLPRARRALSYRTNIANTDMRSPTYERRLEKYSKRGYGIAVPGLEEDALSPSLLASSFAFHEELDLLLKLGQRSSEVKEVCREYSWSHTKLLSGEQQQLELVRGLPRILILDRLRRGLVHSANGILQAKHSVLLKQGDIESSSGHLQLASGLAYQRFTEDGGLEALEESDASRAIKIIKYLADCSEALKQNGPPWGEDQGLTHMPERKQEEWMKQNQWLQWASEREKVGKPVWFVPDRTIYSSDSLDDCRSLFDTGRSFKEGVPQVLQFHSPTDPSRVFWGRHGHAEYHHVRGDWFAGMYAE